MPPTPSSARKQPITLAQLSSYDDILTDALVDHAYYWTTIPKNRPSYHASRGITEQEITKIVQTHLIVDPEFEVAESKLLATAGLRKFHDSLKSQKEKDDFRAHLRRYMRLYLPDCPFEVSSTNRYTIFSHEAAITARKFIKKGQSIKYLSGIQVLITEKEDKELAKRKKDFSIVVSSRNKCAALFMGPARFANHDCGANARLMITGQAGIEIVATQNIDVGDEITVSYAENYFGRDNCECLCKTCEDHCVNGWAHSEGTPILKKSIENATTPEGYSLRRRRRDDSCASTSRTPSLAPEIRPRIRKTRSKTLNVDSDQAADTQALSPEPSSLLQQKRKREYESLHTPPVTPAKKLKTLQYEVEPVPVPESLIKSESDDSSASAQSPSESGSAETAVTDATTPEQELGEPILHSPALTPLKSEGPELKHEESDASGLSDLASTPSLNGTRAATDAPVPTIEPPIVSNEFASVVCASGGARETTPTGLIALPLAIASIPGDAAVSHPASLPETSPTDSTAHIPRRRGRPRKGEERARPSADDGDDMPAAKPRAPGDYTLTPVLLSEPNTAWIHCMNCNIAFVQQNAYYTRSSCPRCERHSKLYGYMWPKTEPEGPNDQEERILDHRIVHRFLDADDEAKIRGRRPPSSYLPKPLVPVSAVVPGQKRRPGRPRKYHLMESSPNSNSVDVEDTSARRSGRRRNPSLRAVVY
ncbi:hypothetical protein F5Y15DRAFT_106409 [Xylariaceae sp. FL0016]|nr:hypothetical protein F5Y15DRAFT_106409 [Xylariaceae sp. FL0016]